MPRNRRLSIAALALGVGAALGLSEVLVRTVVADLLVPGLAMPGDKFEKSDVPGIGWLLKKDEPRWTNRLGLVTAHEVELRKRPGMQRILIVGDSTSTVVMEDAEPVEVLRDLYPTLLEQKLREASGRDVEVVNLSSPGLSLSQELALYRARGEVLDPDVVLFAYCVNDPVETDIGRAENVSIGFPALFSLPALWRYREWESSPQLWYAADTPVSARLERSFGELGELARTRHVAIAVLPVLKDDLSEQPHLPVAEQLAQVSDVPVIDLWEPLHEQGLANFVGKPVHGHQDFIHYDSDGHRALAQALSDRLLPAVRDGRWPP